MNEINPAQAYFCGIMAAYMDSQYISCPITESQIDLIKENISRFCEKIIEDSQLSH